MNKDEFIEYCKDLGLVVTEEKYNLLNKYKELLISWNQKFNLTSIINDNAIYLKHFYDSLCLIKANNLNDVNSLCDIGTGAGFPGLVIKIMFENINIDLIESSFKKCEFLKEVIKKLNLSKINVINERAEVYAKNNREKYNIVTCRAVSNLKVISEICLPLVKVNGYFLPLKSNIDEEIEESKNIINATGGNLINVIKYTLPFENSLRTIPIILKIRKTNLDFPREYNKILKNS